ncbi:MAG: LacI family DNA-binding transcriptional regulator [Eubacteriales bacterium]|nr:LacI family DNA-binding transcriptional regulator [Eubacteriales bacterium]
MVTLKDIARLADVSPSAVSRYLNGGSISEEKAQRIRKVVEETGYRPNPVAQTLRTGLLKQIGVIVPRINSYSVSRVVAGISRYATEKGYSLILCSTVGNDAEETRLLKVMQENQVSGVILMGTALTPEKKELFQSFSVPLVITGQNFPDLHCVYHDDYGAASALAEKMVERGRRHIVYVGVNERDLATGVARRKGAFDVLEASGLSAAKLLALDYSVESGYQCGKRILEEYPDTDGVICATDKLALGAMRMFMEAGKKLPDDISICGIGDDWADALVTPSLTSVRLQHEKCGVDAAEMLFQCIENKNEYIPPYQNKLGYMVIERDSI